MKILLLEYITAGGLKDEPLPESLLREGILMRDALLSDFSDIPDIEVITTYDARISLSSPINQAIRIDKNSNLALIWQNLMKTCDAALIVAPETNAVLTNLTRMLEVVGVKNLGCNQSSVDVTSNKYETYHWLKKYNILTIPTFTKSEFLNQDLILNQFFKNGYVIKPNDGAGCGDTLYFNDLVATKSWLKQSSVSSKHIIQPYLAGIPASISMLCKEGNALVLSCNKQVIEMHLTQTNEKAIQFNGSLVNSLTNYHHAFTKLAQSITKVIPGLNGYIGIDVIINDDNIYVVEINPRITTSYIGLRESLNYNPAKLLLSLANNPLFELPENMTNRTVVIGLPCIVR